MTTAFECYQDYVSLKRHFSSRQYDYMKYRGKVRASIDSFNNRKDKSFFIKVSKLQNPHEFLLANIVENKDSWVGDLAFSKDAEITYKHWKSRKQSLSYIFKNDLDKLKPIFDDNFKIVNNELPYILKLYIRKQVSLETICIFYSLLNLSKKWIDKINDPLYNDIQLKIEKYLTFFQFDKNMIRQIIKDRYINNT